MLIKMDKTIFSSEVETYQNYQTLTGTISITGTVPAVSSLVFNAYFPYERGKTKADIYVKNLTTGVKRPMTGGIRQVPYTFAGSEIISQLASYGGQFISVSIQIANNTGSPIVLIAQTLEVSVVLYELPQA